MNNTILANIIGCTLAAIGVLIYASGIPTGNKEPSFGRFAAGLTIAASGGIVILMMTGVLL